MSYSGGYSEQFAPEGEILLLDAAQALAAELPPAALPDFGGALVPRVRSARRGRGRGFRRFGTAGARDDDWEEIGRIYPEQVMIMALMAASVAGAVVQLLSFGGN